MQVEKNHWLAQKWGSLRLDPNQPLPEEWSFGSGRKFTFDCLCGRKASIKMCNVSNGNTQTCGRCSWRTREHWLAQKWGSLRLDPNQPLPEEWNPWVRAAFQFICDCGRASSIKMYNIHSYSTCGNCNFKPKDFWLAQKWGSLRLDSTQEFPDEWSAESHSEFHFICDCSRRVYLAMRMAVKNYVSCGHCNDRPKEEWLTQKWGSLRLNPNQELPNMWSGKSNKNFLFLCECGRGCASPMYSVTTRNLSCGHCNDKPKEYWMSQRWGLLRLNPNQTLPSEWGTGSKFPCRVLCDLCGEVSSVVFYNLVSRTNCVCEKVGETNHSPEAEVREFVTTLSSDTHPTSYSIEGSKRKYDIYVKSKGVAIEYHGLRWHSERFNQGEARRKDYEKYLISQTRGDRLIQIYSDEWESKQEIFKSMIRDILAPEPKIRVKPTFEVVLGKTPKEALSFLERNHYLGKAGGRLTIIARHKGAVIGVWVFKKKDGAIMWHRACWDRKYKSWNPHEKVLKMALPLLKGMGFTKMVTFSDNRFHTGGLYEKLGFMFEEELPPSYSYTDDKQRKSKFVFRVPAGVNEAEAARAKGWYRIYDSGKKRYSLGI